MEKCWNIKKESMDVFSGWVQLNSKIKMTGRLLFLGLVLIIWMAGCLKNDTPEPQMYAGVAIYHSSPDSPDLNIILDNEVINTVAFKYKNYSNYIEVLEGDRRIRFNNFSDGTNLVDATLNFEVNKSYTLFVINTLSNIELLRISDATDFPSSGTGKVRCLQLSPDAPQVELKWTGESTPLFSGMTFKQVEDFKEVPFGKYSLEVKVIGGTGRTIVVADVEIKEGGYYTILIEGFDNPTAISNTMTARVIAN
jgi:hypothetical protein